MLSDETEFPYTILFGPVPSITKHTDDGEAFYINKLRFEHPHGMILSENT